MANQSFLGSGQVIDSATTEGIPDLRVEAWAEINGEDKRVGRAQTDENGRFIIDFRFSELNMEEAPAFTFKVFRGEELLESAEDAILWNSNSQEDITISVFPIDTRPTGKDRLTAAQVFKGADFLRQSNFSGCFREVGQKAGTNWGFITDMLSNSFSKMDFNPVCVKGPQVGDIIGQDREVATRNIKAYNDNIDVQETFYDPGLNRGSLKDLFSFPLRIPPDGKQVVMLHLDGNRKVRYYSVVKNQDSIQTPSRNTPKSQNEDLGKLRTDLNAAKKSAVQKDKQITELEKQVADLRKEQEDIKQKLDTLLNGGKKPS